jgi:hypothetical protein
MADSAEAVVFCDPKDLGGEVRIRLADGTTFVVRGSLKRGLRDAIAGDGYQS